MSEYMLMFSLGPVQTFIVQARKTRDLWQGSFLLSKLMEEGMSGIDQQALVFPTVPTISGKIPDLPNKYVAIFDTEKKASDQADSSKKAIYSFWKKLCDDVWQQVVDPIQCTQATHDIWDRQTDPEHCFEIYWVVVEGEPREYGKWLECTQRALDARKQFRNFLAQNELGEKSTISGEREALRADRTERKDVRHFWVQLTSNIHASVRDISKEGAERLDAIDTVKRFSYLSEFMRESTHEGGGKGLDFPSTSSIATASYVARLLEVRGQVGQQLQTWLDATRNLAEAPEYAIPYLKQLAGNDDQILKRDGDCLFLETYTAERLRENYNFPSSSPVEKQSTREKAEKLRKATDALLKATDKLDPPLPRPTPYYAIIQMDGDRMGTLLGEVEDIPRHKAISGALSEFSRQDVPRIVQVEHPARLVYAGGDDVLALSPMEYVFKLADDVQTRYRELLKGAVAENQQEKVTASMGIAITHHLAPLSFALRSVRDAEKLAKGRYKRNALVVTVIRRSGEQTRVGCHWHYPQLTDENAQPLKLFTTFYEYFRDDVLSPKCVYLLLEEASTLVKLHPDAQKSEVKRIVRRQRNDMKKEKLSDEDVKALAERVVDLAQEMDKEPHEGERATELHIDDVRYGLVEVFGWMLVAAFLARKGQDE